VANGLPLIGVDACVLIEAVRLPNGPSAYLLQAAALGVFQLWLVENVDTEARRALNGPNEATELDTLLSRCDISHHPAPEPEEILRGLPRFAPLLRHVNDVPIAVAIRAAQPDAFVSSNHKHWKPSLSPALGGVAVMTPRRLLEELGVPAPPKR